MISVRVHGVGMSPYNQGFVALLMDDVNNEWLPIYIGSFEAQAIAMELDDVDPPRPMTHDLMTNIIGSLDVEVKKIVVNALKDSTYYAEITLERETEDDESEEIVIDARPSDSIALALRTDADIFVDEGVMEEASVPAKPEDEESEEAKKLKILQHRLQRAVEEEEFEEAAELRDQIKNVQQEMRRKEESEEDIDEDIEEQLAEELGGEEGLGEDFGEDISAEDFEEFERHIEEESFEEEEEQQTREQEEEDDEDDQDEDDQDDESDEK